MSSSLYYDKDGNFYETLEENKCYCKKVGPNFYIRKVNSGLESGSCLSKDLALMNKNLDRQVKGQPFTTFRKVSEGAFKSYVSYLRTGRIGFLRIAERE